MKKRIAAGALAVVVAVPMLRGQIIPGLGPIPVIDFSVLTEAVTTALNAIKTVRELQRTYDMMNYEYRRLGNLGRFRSPMSVWNQIGRYADAHGTIPPQLRGWIDAVNTGRRTADVWRDATYRWPFPYSALDTLPADQRDRKTKDLMTLDAIDQSAIAGLESVGQTRYYGATQEQHLRELVFDETADNADAHSQNFLLQRSNLYAGLQAKMMNDMQKMQAYQAEQSLLVAKQRRDAEILAMAAEQNAREMSRQTSSNATGRTLMAWRF